MMKLTGISGWLLASGALVFLGGCSTLSCGDPHPYLSSVARPPLRAPAGVSVPPPDPTYEIQGITSSGAKSTGRDASGICLVNPPQVIKAQPVASKKSVSTTMKTESLPHITDGGQPMANHANQIKTPVPASGTSIAPPAVATPQHME